MFGMDTAQLIYIAVIAALAFGGVMLLVMALAGAPGQAVVRQRLDRYTSEADFDTDLRRPFAERVVAPALRRSARVLLSLTPQQILDDTAQRLEAAGSPRFLGATEFVGLQMVIGVLMGLGVFSVLTLMHMPTPVKVLFFILIFGLGVLIPKVVLTRMVEARRMRIRKALPDVLDLLIVSVEAGLALDGAMSLVIDKMKGPLSEEFSRVLREIRTGAARIDAMRDMATRCGVQELRSFVSALYQAEQLGASIGDVLRAQADQLRVNRRQRAEEAAHKMPVKLLFPLIFLIFPALLIVILGPAGITIMRVLQNVVKTPGQ